jgi:hypothetical protein
MLTSAHKAQKMDSSLTFLERYYKDGEEFLNHMARVKTDDTWVSFVIVKTKEQSKQWMHSHLPNGSQIECRSQWPRGLTHELPSPAQTLGSWV